MAKSTKKIHSPRQTSREDRDDPNWDNTHPVFCLGYMNDDYCITRCDKEHKAALIETMRKLSRLRWAEIKTAHRHGVGFEKLNIPDLYAKSKILLPSWQEGIKIIAFRYHGKNPMVGFREKNVFHILWIDRDFTLYKH